MGESDSEEGSIELKLPLRLRLVLFPIVMTIFASPAPGNAPAAARVDRERAAGADEDLDNWLLHGRTHSEQRHSPLRQINKSNVESLGLAWSYATGSTRGLEATPLVIDGVLYATSTWSEVFALDAKTGRELWRYDPGVSRAVGRKACCDVVNRGLAAWRGKLYLGSLDGRLIALDAATGTPVWQVQTVPIGGDYTITSAPRIVEGKVIIGNSGGEYGVRGFFSAYDAAEGKLLWRFYTVPGHPSQPAEHPELVVAAKTWSPDSNWESGLGGTVWDSMAYDPELGLLYVGVGNSSPYDRSVRSPGGGDNLFLTCILAVDPNTGRLAWYYQTTPGESWDYTATQHMILADLEIGGRARKVIMQAPKNGFFYVLDRKTGELISAEKLGPINWASHVDMKTGRPVETGRADWSKESAIVMPGPAGVHNWHPMSFSPDTGLVYIPTLENAWSYAATEQYRHVPGDFNTGEDWVALGRMSRWAIPFCNPSHLTAWNPVTQSRVWRVEHDHPANAGVLSTSGGLVFQGKGDGYFAAYDAVDGSGLWSSRVGIGIIAAPITYRVDGEQFVAVLAGLGGSPLLNYQNYTHSNAGRVFAFKLGGKSPMPISKARPPGTRNADPIPVSAETLGRGADLYATYCTRCHGPWARSTGWLPDLRHSSRAVHEAWESIVLGGAFAGKGMAGFADRLDRADAQAIHAFVLDRAMAETSLVERAHSFAMDNLCMPASLLAD
jgi:quinohemoprotein ethanol dehydrogenase